MLPLPAGFPIRTPYPGSTLIRLGAYPIALAGALVLLGLLALLNRPSQEFRFLGLLLFLSGIGSGKWLSAKLVEVVGAKYWDRRAARHPQDFQAQMQAYVWQINADTSECRWDEARQVRFIENFASRWPGSPHRPYFEKMLADLEASEGKAPK
jgi:hypothetical protein